MAPPPLPPASGTFSGEGLQLAFILVLFTFGGWNEMAYVAAEIKRPQHNIVRGLVIGTVAEIRHTPDRLFQQATISPAAPTEQTRFVQIVKKF